MIKYHVTVKYENGRQVSYICDDVTYNVPGVVYLSTFEETNVDVMFRKVQSAIGIVIQNIRWYTIKKVEQ